MGNLFDSLYFYLTPEEREKVRRIGQDMANEKGKVFMNDVILTIFHKGLALYDDEVKDDE